MTCDKGFESQYLSYIIACALPPWSSWTWTRLTKESRSPEMGFPTIMLFTGIQRMAGLHVILLHSPAAMVYGIITWRCLAHLKGWHKKMHDHGEKHLHTRRRGVFFSPSTDTWPYSTPPGRTQHFTATKQSSWVTIHALSLDNREHTRCLKGRRTGQQKTQCQGSKQHDGHIPKGRILHAMLRRFVAAQVKHFGWASSTCSLMLTPAGTLT